MSDAVVIGSGPNGLVAANVLADAGWDVVVLEAAATPGGAVRTEELTEPGFHHDVFSAFYPLGIASPRLRALGLEDHGLRWRHADVPLANPFEDGRCASIHHDVNATAASLEAFAPGDGDAWRSLYARWERLGGPLLDALLRPFPPVRPVVQMVRRLGPGGVPRFARFGILPARRMAEEEFAGEGGALLLAGNALHSDLAPESAGGGLFGWLLCGLAQQVGFPAPEGGAGRLTAALVDRLESRGGRLELNARVTRVEIRDRRAVGVVTEDGTTVVARRAVVADVVAPQLFLDLVGPAHLPAGFVDDLGRFQFDHGTVKVDWALRAPIPWSAPEAAGAGTVHLADSMDHLTMYSAELATGRLPRDPFLLVGQMTTADPTRSPAGTETAWAYTHVPQHARGDAGDDGLKGIWDDEETERFADRMEDRMEHYAPGFRDLILGRHVFTPRTMPEANESLVRGAVNAGTAQLHQQLVFRPAPGLARPQTPVRGLYLASASAHPGGGVHGAPGANAARAALAAERLPRRLLNRR